MVAFVRVAPQQFVVEFGSKLHSVSCFTFTVIVSRYSLVECIFKI